MHRAQIHQILWTLILTRLLPVAQKLIAVKLNMKLFCHLKDLLISKTQCQDCLLEADFSSHFTVVGHLQTQSCQKIVCQYENH